MALTATPPTLDLHRTTATVTLEVGWHLYEYLVTIDSQYKVVPSLAEKVDINDYYLAETYRLAQAGRKG